MSDSVNREWFYQIRGRFLHLYKHVDYPSGYPDQLGRFLNQGNTLLYPDEDITNGLRVEYTAIIEPFASEANEDLTGKASGTTISFSSDTISDSASGFGSFADSDKIRVRGSASNDGDYTVTTAAAGSLVCTGAGFTTESASESITIFQIPKEVTSPDETSHINLNRLLSLAVVDYIKAMLAEQDGDIRLRDYYMRKFFEKIADNESNKIKSMVNIPRDPFALR